MAGRTSRLHGLLNIHKPRALTSRAMVDLVSVRARTRQVGHAGTLDPLATGVLVLCLGWTTRLVSWVQDQAKEYRAEFLLGCTSDTDDVTGQVAPVSVLAPPTQAEIEALLPRFRGRIEQVPPAFSAVHVGGRRAHQLARGGDTVEIAPRPVEVYRLELLSYEYPRLELLIECGSGTYVRSIGRDLGRLLGCGAVMSGLIRTRVGVFQLSDAIDPATLTRENLPQQLVSPLTAVAHLPRYACSAAEIDEIHCGRPIAVPEKYLASSTEAAEAVAPRHICLVTPVETLAAIAEFDEAARVLRPRQVFLHAAERSAAQSPQG